MEGTAIHYKRLLRLNFSMSSPNNGLTHSAKPESGQLKVSGLVGLGGDLEAATKKNPYF